MVLIACFSGESTICWLETLPEPEGDEVVLFPENTGDLLRPRDPLNAGPSWCRYGWRSDYSKLGEMMVTPGSTFPSSPVCSLRLLIARWELIARGMGWVI